MFRNAPLRTKKKISIVILVSISFLTTFVLTISLLGNMLGVMQLHEVHWAKLHHAVEIEISVQEQINAYKSIPQEHNFEEQKPLLNKLANTITQKVESIENILNKNNFEESTRWKTVLQARAAFHSSLKTMDQLLALQRFERSKIFFTEEIEFLHVEYINSLQKFIRFQTRNMHLLLGNMSHTFQKFMIFFFAIIFSSIMIILLFFLLHSKPNDIKIWKIFTHSKPSSKNSVTAIGHIQEETENLKVIKEDISRTIKKLYSCSIEQSKAIVAQEMNNEFAVRSSENDYLNLIQGFKNAT